MPNWLLPEYIQDMLPDEAWVVERMRAQFLDLLRKSGYQLVAPPMLEYVESLLIQHSHDMDLRTFKLVDQLSGRTLALRADITPQAARVDAHLLNCKGVTRLCYAGNVLHTQPAGLTSTRELLQIGAELYGHSGIESDLEIQQLMLESLRLFGITEVHLDLGHVAVFRSLMSRASVSDALEEQLFDALQGKDRTTLAELSSSLCDTTRTALLALTELYGDYQSVLARARQVLPAYPEIIDALNALERVAAVLSKYVPSCGIDLADLRGYHYHTGIVFAVYHESSHDAIALGGRYDELGVSFGRARPATGFSMDLRQLYRLVPKVSLPKGVYAPNQQDEQLLQKIAVLRAAGESVVVDLLGDANLAHELQCDRQLVCQNGEWQVVSL